MIKDWLRNSKNGNIHPPEETLLKSLDGELSLREAGRVREHLELCWTCRLSLEKLEETISTFVEFRQKVQIPLIQDPPNNWSDFNRRLKNAADSAVLRRETWWTRNKEGIYNLFHDLRPFSDWSPLRRQGLIAGVAALLIAVAIWQLVVVPPVSANELLDKSLQFQSRQIKDVAQPVVYQKLRVQSPNAPEFSWELWLDATRSRFRESAVGTAIDGFKQEIQSVLQSNGLSSQEPLSPKAFANWRNTLAFKSDTVEKARAENGDDLFVVRTINLNADSPGKISEGILILRPGDYHPVGQRLRVLTAGGFETYEFTELDFQVLSLTAFAPEFFPEPAGPEYASVPEQLSETDTGAAPESNTAVPNSANGVRPSLPNAAASADLEVEVLRLLNQAKADLGEQLTVKREADGPVHVRGLVDTPERKDEILAALQSVRNNPAVRVELKTIAEALSEQKGIPQPSGNVDMVESQGTATAAESELLNFVKTEEEARRFGGQIVARSGRAMRRAYALKRLAGQFRPDELRHLSPEARDKLLALVRSHASAFREECAGLRRELQPVFGPIDASAAETPDVGDVVSVPRAVEVLLLLASTNDRVVRSAFTLSSSGQNFSAIKTPQFWQSLKTAEALAVKLQSVR